MSTDAQIASKERRRRATFDVPELLLISGFLSVVVWIATRPAPQVALDDEGARLQATYGPSRDSQFIE